MKPTVSRTIRFAGFLFLVSAVFGLLSTTSPVALFGDIRSGPAAVVYHLIYVALFASVGIGLWWGKRWGPAVLLGTTVFYTADRLLYLLSESTRQAEFAMYTQGYEELVELIDMQTVNSAIFTITITTLVCWWGFAAYVYWKRESFER